MFSWCVCVCMCVCVCVPAMRMTALSAGSRMTPEADLERFRRWCLGRFHGNVSPGNGELLMLSSLELSSEAALTSGLLLGRSSCSVITWEDQEERVNTAPPSTYLPLFELYVCFYSVTIVYFSLLSPSQIGRASCRERV